MATSYDIFTTRTRCYHPAGQVWLYKEPMCIEKVHLSENPTKMHWIYAAALRAMICVALQARLCCEDEDVEYESEDDTELG